MSTIPASELVRITPGVLAAGGSSFTLNGLMLTTSIRPPIGAVPSFPDADSVGDYFGPTSSEKAMADVYFGGFEGSDKKPGELLFAQYNVSAAAAYLRGGSLAAMTLAELQSLIGPLAITVDGTPRDGGTINLSAATSFSTAATLIEAALNSDIDVAAEFTGSIAGTIMTVTGTSAGTITEGLVVSGSAGQVTAGTVILEQLTGSAGGTGTYSVSVSQTVGSLPLTAQAADVDVAFDSVSSAFIITSGITGPLSSIAYATGSLSSSIKLTEVTGAVISAGAEAATPAGCMDAVKDITQNWALFTHLFNPDTVGSNTLRLQFSDWTDAQNSRFGYAPWDDSDAPAVTNDAPTSLGQQVYAAEYAGTAPVYDPTAGSIPALVLGIAASIDFDAVDGRTDFAFRRQTGLTAGVTSAIASQNLLANHYNFYGAYGSAADEFVNFYKGTISGPFTWLDSFVNQIWLNNRLQVALLTLLREKKSVPYNPAGRTMIEASLNSTIAQALSNGVIRAGVELSGAQAASVNAAAGVKASGVLTTRGWYLQVLAASPEVRAVRGSPPMKFWYTDGQSVQTIDMASINVQ